MDGDNNAVAHAHIRGGVRPMRDDNLLADADVGKGGMEMVHVTHVFELHLMAVRCNSRIPQPRKYWKFREGSGGDFLPKGATQIFRAPDSTLQLFCGIYESL